MKARLSVAAILILVGFILWQHRTITELRQKQTALESAVREQVKHDSRIKDPVTAVAPQSEIPKRHAVPDVPFKTSHSRPESREVGDISDHFQSVNFRMTAPVGPAPGSRKIEASYYRNVIIDPAKLPAKPTNLTPYGLYGR